MRAILVLGLFSLLLSARATAQVREARIFGQGLGYIAREGVRQSQNHGQGFLAGGEIQARLGKVSLGVQGLFGRLSSDSGGSEGHTLRITRVSLMIQPSTWLRLGPQAESQRSTERDTVTVWRLFGARAAIDTRLGVQGLTGTVDASWYPAQQWHSTDGYSARLRNGNSLEVGVGYEFARYPVAIDMNYRVEIYSLQGESLRRGGLLIKLGVRLI